MPAVTIDELQDSSQPGLADPFMLDKWRFLTLPQIGGVSLSPLACEEVGLPFPVFQQKSKEVATTSTSWPSATSVEGFTAQFSLDEKLAVIKYYTAWQNLIQNPYTGGFRLPSQYKKNLQVALFNTQGTQVMVHELRSVWPLGMQELTLNGTGGRGMISIQFECDVARPIFS
ncbi:putative tail tube protein [Erwinia phage vB_EamM_Yoloswag]|uniref:Putative tail tube protein n=1 Tax=Erwinia phage vB_EamM_Yoloswag TaxID=1958956 RepID=A0A1S6L350_9CAUD|nr:putative tail tube protein [Erwinia phage vB_EamM_Yoloswag]AQT28611.1 putative tail tube protein [Erwinia phage vB_EamM_Yoloswag]